MGVGRDSKEKVSYPFEKVSCIMFVMKPDDIKKQNEELLDKVSPDSLEVVYDKDRDIKVPLKVGLRKQVALSDLPVIWLFSLGNLSVKEYNDYLKSNEGKLSINEIAASDLLSRVLKNEKDSVNTYWRLNERMLATGKGLTPSVNINIKPNAVMSQLLNSIEGEIFKDSPENTLDSTPTDSVE